MSADPATNVLTAHLHKARARRSRAGRGPSNRKCVFSLAGTRPNLPPPSLCPVCSKLTSPPCPPFLWFAKQVSEADLADDGPNLQKALLKRVREDGATFFFLPRGWGRARHVWKTVCAES